MEEDISCTLPFSLNWTLVLQPSCECIVEWSCMSNDEGMGLYFLDVGGGSLSAFLENQTSVEY